MAAARAAPRPRQVLTLCFLVHNKRMLLGLKKRGFGQGKVNGFGGKVEKGETIEEATVREFEEEAGVRVLDVQRRGVILFDFVDKDRLLEVHVFRCSQWKGEVAESEEMQPVWYHTASLPYERMWADDRSWLPLLLAGQFFAGYYLFQGTECIVEERLKQLPVASQKDMDKDSKALAYVDELAGDRLTHMTHGKKLS